MKKKKLSPLLIRRIRAHLISEMGVPKEACSAGYVPLVQTFAKAKYGITLEGEADVYRWVDHMIRLKAFDNLIPANVCADGEESALTNKYNRYITESLKWQKIRSAILERDGRRCVNCGSRSVLNVHHLNYDHLYGEEKFPADLITLCRGCHGDLHKSGDKASINRLLAAKVSKKLRKIPLVFTEAEIKMMKAKREDFNEKRKAHDDLITGTYSFNWERLIKATNPEGASQLIALMRDIKDLKTIKDVRTAADKVIISLRSKFEL